MSTPRIKTVPDLIESSPQHKEAKEIGNDHFRLWERNVIDDFKSLNTDEIKNKLSATAFPYAICCENLIGDFNMATVFRCANAFNAKEVFYIGDKKFDKRGCQGVYNYMNITWLPTIEDFIKLKERYVVVGIDNITGSVPLSTYNWKKNTLMIFGNEGVGITPAMKAMCDDIVFIQQFGSVRSLNVATASGIIMNDFVTKFLCEEKCY